MGCDGACAAGFDLVFIGLPLLSLYEIPMLIWFIWRAFHWKRDDKDWLKGTAILAIAVVAPVLLWLSAWYAWTKLIQATESLSRITNLT